MAYRIGIDARKLTDYGIGTYVQHLIRGLAARDRDNEYFLFVGEQGAAALFDLPDNFHTVIERSPGYSVRELFAVTWQLLRHSIDLYHATHYVLPIWVPGKSIVTIHDIIHLLYPEFLPNRFAFFYAQRMIARALAASNRVLTDSQSTRNDLVSYFDTDVTKIDVVYPGIERRFLQPVEPTEIDRVRQRFSLTKPYALFVGNPKPHKNLPNILSAFAGAVIGNDFDVDLVCAGGHMEEHEHNRHTATRLGIDERFKTLGYVEDEDLPALYQGAEVFLYPTLYEGFGLPAVEAMASGIPVITSNTSALKEIAQGAARLVDPLNIQQMSQEIARCLTDENLRRELKQAGRERAANYSWDQAAERVLEAYRSTLEEGYFQSS